MCVVARTLLLALACASTTGCPRPEPIRVGFVAGLSGRHYDLGVSCRNGAQLAVDALNAAGGVRGRPLELLIRDDAQDPETARRAVRELIDAGVVAVVGHCTSAMAHATLPLADEAHVLMVAPTVSSSALMGRDDWLVLGDASGTTSAQGLASYVNRRWPGLRVAVIYDLSNRVYSEPWRDAFRAALEAGPGRVGELVPFTSGEGTSFGTLADAALTDRPEAVLVVANALDTAMLSQQLRRRAPQVQLLGTGWGFTEDLPQHGGAAVEGALFVHKVDSGSALPAAVRFREEYARRFGKPPVFSAIEAYESVQLLAAALARDATREGVRREVLRLGTVHGLTEDFTLDRFGDAHRRDHISTIRDGRFRLLE
jgi:branched-chain amino acid transport system substrate-binding protein